MKHFYAANNRATEHLFSTILLLFLSSFSVMYAQTNPTDHFRSRTSGDWKTSSTWESSADGFIWVNSTLVPNELSASILIKSGDSVFTTTTHTADQMVVESGAVFCINSLFNLFNGEDIDLDVYGRIRLNAYLSTTAEILMRSGSQYIKDISKNFALNICTWEEGSTIVLKLTTTPTSDLTNLNQTFYNFIWDGKGQMINYNLKLPPVFSVAHDMTILSTNGWQLILSQSVTTVQYNIAANLKIKDNSMLLLTSGTGAVSLNIGGNVEVGDNVDWCRIDVGANNPSTVFQLAGNLIIANNSKIFSSKVNGKIQFTNSIINQHISYIGTGRTQNVNFVIDENVAVLTNFLNIDLNYSLTLEPGSSLTAPTFTNSNPDFDNIIIKDGASIFTNSNNVKGTMQRTLSNADWSIPQDGWHLISAPVASQALAAGGFLDPEYDFFAWSEPQNLWLNQKIAGNNITSFNPGQGYFVAYDNGGTKSFTGTFNVASIPFNNLSKTETSLYSGYHLLGNPFPCALDWNNAAWNRQNISEVAMVWNETAMNYLPVTTSTNNIIPANQGFFIQAILATNAITIPQEARTHSNAVFNKKCKVAEQLHLKVKPVNMESWDEVIIQLDAGALTGYDNMDGHEMQGSEYAPQLYSVIAENEMLCVNTLPMNQIPPIVPLHFRPGFSNTYTLEVLGNTMSKPVYLEDVLSGNIILLKDSATLDFTAYISDDPRRFRLHMGPVGLPESELNSQFQVYSYGNTVYFKDDLNSEPTLEYILRDLAGNIIARGKLDEQPVALRQFANIATGIYLVSVIRNAGTQVFKVLIKN